MMLYKINKASNGDAWWRTTDDEQYPPSQIGEFVLTKMKETTKCQLGKSTPKAMIIVSTQFNDTLRQATKDAGYIASLDVERIINKVMNNKEV